MKAGPQKVVRSVSSGCLCGHDSVPVTSRGLRLSRRALFGAFLAAAAVRSVGSALAAGDAEQIAAWFFERYLLQSIGVARFNAERISAEASKAVESETPSLQRFLTKHRPAFVAALLPKIDALVPAGETATVAREVASEGTKISARTREWLVAIDDDFQKNEQRLLRAMAYELNVIVEQIVINIRKTP